MKVVTQWNVSLYDMLKAYGDIERRKEASQYDLPTFELMSTDNAMSRLSKMLGNLPKTGAHQCFLKNRALFEQNHNITRIDGAIFRF